MAQYIKKNSKLSNSQLHKLKSAIKNETEVALRLSPSMIGGSNDETNFPLELLLTDRQVLAFVKLLLIMHQLILNFQRLSYQK